MIRKFICGLTAGLLAIAGVSYGQEAPDAAGEKKTEIRVDRSEYYPLELGTEWKYDVNDRTVVVRVTKHEMINGTAAAKVETYLDEKLLSSEHIFATKEGVYRASFDGAVATKPVMILKLPPKDGEGWDVVTEITGSKIRGTAGCRAEKLDLPAGKFDAYRVSGQYIITDPDGAESEAAFRFWFAEGTGVVQLATGSGDQEVVLKLKSFQRGK